MLTVVGQELVTTDEGNAFQSLYCQKDREEVSCCQNPVDQEQVLPSPANLSHFGLHKASFSCMKSTLFCNLSIRAIWKFSGWTSQFRTIDLKINLKDEMVGYFPKNPIKQSFSHSNRVQDKHPHSPHQPRAHSCIPPFHYLSICTLRGSSPTLVTYGTITLGSRIVSGASSWACRIWGSYMSFSLCHSLTQP